MSSTSQDHFSKVRQNLTLNLKLIIKKIQYHATSSCSETLQNSDITNSLCYVLEAIFLVGLKSPHSSKVILDATSNTKINAPSFWHFVLSFTHNDVTAQLSGLKFITNEVGLCRSWIRVALNDGLLSSYITAILEGDAKKKRKFYNKESYWFDNDQLALLTGLLQGISTYTFELPYNVSLLNSWGTTPLELAGYFKVSQLPLLFPAESLPKSLNIESKTDVNDSENVKQTSEQNKETFKDLDIVVSRRRRKKKSNKQLRGTTGNLNDWGSVASFDSNSTSGIDRISTAYGSEFQFDESIQDGDHSTVEKSEVKNGSRNSYICESNPELSSFAHKTQNGESRSRDSPPHQGSGSLERQNLSPVREDRNHTVTLQNNNEFLSTTNSASSPRGTIMNEEVAPQVDNKSSPQGNDLGLLRDCSNATWTDTARSSPSIYALLGLNHLSNSESAYFTSENDNNQTNNSQSDLSNGGAEINVVKSSDATMLNDGNGSGSSTHASQDFEFVSKPTDSPLNLTEVTANDFKSMYTTLTHEMGLPSQNYMCKGCSSPIGTIYGSFKVCAFDSHYYCSRCHCDDEAIIPAFIVNNWDFTPFKVSCAAKTFLCEMENEPLIDFEVINNNLYDYIAVLRSVYEKRKRLKYAANYLLSCCEMTANEVRGRLWPKDYILTNLHLYSVQDLIQVQSGYFHSHLQKVIDFCIKHIRSCIVCKEKGFICEICRDVEVIYAFDVHSTVTCEKCFTVFHKSCKSDYAPCPKCVRRASYSAAMYRRRSSNDSN